MVVAPRKSAPKTSGAPKSPRRAPVKSPTTAMAAKPARVAVVVLTMHRSGSSALTRVLNLLGCDMPKTLMGGDKSNETGYWESTVVRALNDDILSSGGSDWQDWDAFNPAWYTTVRYGEFLPRAAQVLADEYGPASLIALKDPRMCRIFPIWRQMLADEGFDTKVIIALRNPVEVAASLLHRNGVSEVHGLLLWLRHTLEAEHASRGLDRCVVSYEALMSRPVDLMTDLQNQLGLVWPRLSTKVAGEIATFISPRLRHHKAADDAAVTKGQLLRVWLEQAYNVFQRWSQSGEDVADHPALDQLRMSMNDLSAPLGEVVATLTRQTVGIAEKDKEIGYLRGEAGKRGDAIAALTAEKASLKKDSETARANAAAMTEQLAELKSKFDALATAEAAHKETSSRLASIEAAYQAVQTELAAKEDELAAARGRARDHAARLLEVETALQSASETAAEANAIASQLKEDVTARDSKIAYLRGEAGKRGDAVAALTAEKASLKKDSETARANAAAMTEQLAELKSKFDALATAEAAHKETSSRLASIEAAYQAVQTELAAKEDELAAARGRARDHAARLLEVETALQSASETAAEANAIASQLKEDVTARDSKIAAIEADLDTLKQENVDLSQTVAKTTAERDEARSQVARDAQLRQDHEAAAARHLSELGAMAKLVEAADTHAQDIETTLNELRQSSSENQQASEAETRALRDSLQTTLSALEQRSHEAEQTAAAYQEARQQADALASEIETLKTKLAESDAAAQLVTQNAIAEANAMRAQSIKDLSERDRAVTKLRQRMNDFEGEIGTQSRDLAAMAKIILDKEEALKIRNAAAHEALKVANDSEKRIKALHDEVARLKNEAEVAQLRREEEAAQRHSEEEVAKMKIQEEVAQLRAEIDTRNRLLAEAEGKQRALIASTSWRITAPMRRIVSAFRR